jgi:hypothetical protein
VFLFLKNGFSALIGINEVYRITGLSQQREAEVKADTPMSVIKGFFDKL